MAFTLPSPLRLHLPLRLRPNLTQKRPRTTARLKPQPNLEALVSRTTHLGVDRGLARKVLSQASDTARDWAFSATDFLTPPESAALHSAASHLHDLHVRAWGGYDDADRTVLVFAHHEVVPDQQVLHLVHDHLSVLDLQGQFATSNVTHRDFMGAILNAGITRAKIGDINLLDDTRAQAVVRTDIASILASSVTQVRNASVSTAVIPISELILPTRRVKEIVSIEASLRLDSLSSAAFKLSRTKMADMVRSGLVRINYVDVRTPAKVLKSGDVVSARGLGKVEIGAWDMTSKGKYRITLKKYV